ncbi:MAG: hypothetical protein IKF82_05575 [Bacilli bacterium]|nr:hypothetical protein [Bacilli bacterium]
MKIDKKQSVKNKVGVVLASLALSSTLMTPTALAASRSYSNDQVKMDFIYESGIEPLVMITDLETGDYVVIKLDELDEILKRQTSESVVIYDKNFSRDGILETNEKYQNAVYYSKIFESFLFLAGVGVGCYGLYGIVDAHKNLKGLSLK